jgi:translation initiation factor IF-3
VKDLRKNNSPEYRINKEIRVPFVRLVGDNVEPVVIPTREAIQKAEAQELDLVEISPNADPPVVKIIDYQKFLYQQKKRQKEIQANSNKDIIKEIRFGPQTDEHDFNFKLNHAKTFLNDGCKVKAYVFFKGRSIIYKEQGEILLLKLAQALEEYGKIDKMPVLEGKRMQILLTPKPKQVKK